MISEERAKEIDYYFFSDDGRRRRDFWIASGAAGTIVLLCVNLGLHRVPSLVVASVIAALVILTRIATYAPPSVYLSRKKRQVIYTADQIVFDRRMLAMRLPLVGFAVFLIAITPKLSEAESVNRRLRMLLLSNRKPEAEKLASQAVESGVVLDVDVVAACSTSSFTSPDMSRILSLTELSPSDIPQDSAQIALASGLTLDIRRPIFFFPAGKMGPHGPFGYGFKSLLK